MYQVLARKWRPQSFEEVVGQPHVARTLRNAVAANRIAHAYIFAGVRGTGKTTVARILAKCLNCATGPTPAPCGRCAPCVEIAEGRSMDVLEMDAATRTGVDDIRELQEVVAYAPVRDRHKILIIDEAHMLSKAASNALLKTLEEPPSGVVFVLATTELHKILPTILSRCQVFEFRRVPPKEVAPHLRAVCQAEGIRVSDATLERIARAAEGSVRDALSILEGVVAFCGGEIRDADALELLGGVRSELLTDLVAGLAARDAQRMLTALDRVADEGVDLVHFWSELLAVLRDLLLMRRLPGRADLLGRSREEAAALAAAAQRLSDEDLLRSFQIVAELEPGLKASSHPRFLFEAGLVRLASLGEVRPIEELLGLLLEGETRGADGGGGPAGGPSDRSSGRAAAPSRPAAPPRPQGAGGPEASGADFATALRADLYETRPMLAVALEQAASVVLEGGTLALDLGSDAVRGLLERGDNRAAIEERASRIVGSPVKLVVNGAPVGPPQARAPKSPPHPAAGARPGRPAAGPGRFPGREAVEEITRKEPGVRSLLREFGAQVLDLRSLAPAPELRTLDELQDPGETAP